MQTRPRKYFDENGLLIIKPYRIKDLCAIFDVTRYVMNNWVKQNSEVIGKKRGQYFSAEQVSIMVGRFGMPFINNNYKKDFF